MDVPARHALTLRVATDEHEALRTFAFLSNRSVNDVVCAAIREYLAGQGRRDATQAAITAVLNDHRKALDVLAER